MYRLRLPTTVPRALLIAATGALAIAGAGRLATAQPPVSGPSYASRTVPVHGRVAARGAVLRDADGSPALAAAGGRPWVAEYDDYGRLVRRVGPVDDKTILSTAAWNAYVDQWAALRATAVDRFGEASLQTLAASAYPGALTCRAADGSLRTPGGALPPRTQWVLVVQPEVGTAPSCDDVLVASSPISPPDVRESGDRSLLVESTSGLIVDRSAAEQTFAIESAFFTPREDDSRCQEREGPVDANGAAFIACSPGRHHYVWAPIPGARVETVSGYGFPQTATDAAGRFELSTAVPQVPTAMVFNPFALYAGDPLSVQFGDAAFFNLSVYAEVRWGQFNPRTPSSRTYYLWQRHARSQVLGSGADTGVGLYWANFALDAAMLHAVVVMTNDDYGQTRPSGPTSVGPDCSNPGRGLAPQAIPLVDPEYSFDEFTRYQYTAPSTPGQRRSQGLVEQISAADLRDSDVYLYRASDNVLIGARWGFSEREVAGVVPPDAPGATVLEGCENGACLDFNVMTRGPVSRGFTGGTVHTGHFDPHTTGRGASRLEVDYLDPDSPYLNFLRTGDSVRIVIVNRVTGYIGTTSVCTDNRGGQLWIGDPGGVFIEMRPPNLRVTARRVYDRTGRDDVTTTRRRTLGSEGSAVNTDTVIEITTEWWDDDGRPLPPDLPGYTGRLARVIEGGRLEAVGTSISDAAASDGAAAELGAGQFQIRPGYRTQIVHYPLEGIERAHYYLHVDAAPPESTVDFMARYGRRGPDFSVDQVCYSQGDSGYSCIDRNAGDGPLAQRPASFVPLLVQQFDASATRAALSARAAELRADCGDCPDPPVLDGVEPVYGWLRSPEYQFSVVDLDVREVELVTEHDERLGLGRTETTIDYGLADGVDPLDPASGHDDERSFGIGYGAVVALIDEDGRVDTREVDSLPSTEDLALMTPSEQARALDAAVSELESDDFLVLQLYDSGDRGNALWEADGSILMVSDAHPITLERRYETARFDASASSAPDHIDSHDILRFRLFEVANVEARIVTSSEHTVALVSAGRLPPGLHHVLIDASDVLDRAGVDVSADPTFRVEIVATPITSFAPDVTWTQRVVHRGRVEVRRSDLQTGQVAIGDDRGAVILRDGALRLARHDFVLPGAGPQLAFARSYSNLATETDESPLGVGWSHNWHTLRLQGLVEGDGDGDGLPDWRRNLDGRFFAWGEVPASIREPSPSTTEWTSVVVNGTRFVRVGAGTWLPEQGRHGTLERSGDELIYTAEDATRYHYPIPAPMRIEEIVVDAAGTTTRHLRVNDPLVWAAGFDPAELILGTETSSEPTRYFRPIPSGPTQLSRIVDRNGNVLSYDYDAEGRLARVYTPDGREIAFHYVARAAPSGLPYRLDRVTASGGIELQFAYDEHGNLASIQRDRRLEEYRYAPENGVESGPRNLTEVIEHPSTDVDLVTRYEYFTRAALDPAVTAAAPGLRASDMIFSTTHPAFAGEPIAVERYGYVLEGSAIVRTVENGRHETTRFVLNAAGNPLRIEEPLGRTTVLEWSGDDAGAEDNVLLSRTESVEASRTRTTTYEYQRDTDGRLIRQTEIDARGGSRITVYDPRWRRPLSITDPNNRTEEFRLDAAGNTLRHIDGNLYTTTYTYGARGLVESIQQPGNPRAQTFTYDAHGNVDTVTSAEQRLTDVDFDIRGRLVAVRDALNNETRYFYDPLDNLIRIEHPALAAPEVSPDEIHLSNVEEMTYDALGRQLTRRDRNGAVVTKTYTARGQVHTISRSPGGGTRELTYDADGNVLSETDWSGHATTHTYDALGRRDSTTDRLGHTAFYEPDLAGRVVRFTDFAGRVTEYDHDDLDRPTREEVIGGRRLDMTYYAGADPARNLHTVTETRTPLASSTTTFTYDGAYRLATRVNARGRTATWEYDPDGDLRLVTDEEENTRAYEHDEDHNLRFVRDALDGRQLTTEYVYDERGNRVEMIDPRTRSTTYRYDAWNRLIATELEDETEDGTGARVYSSITVYDGVGNPILSRDPRGIVRQTLRDPLGRVVSAIDGERHTTGFEYDTDDRVRYIRGPRATTRFDYDLEGRETLVVEAEGRPEQRSTEVVTRDAMGNPTHIRDYRGNVTEFVYDENYQPERIVPPTGPEIRRTYSRNGLLLSTTDRRNATTDFEYDELDRRVAVIDPLERRADTAYDEVGTVVRETDRRRIVTRYELDDLYRVRHVYRDEVRQISSDYDDLGNVSLITDARGHQTSFTYNARDLVTRITSPRGAFDLSDPVRTMRYDGAGNLIYQRDEAGVESTFGYDGENRRETMTVAGETSLAGYDADGNLELVTSAEGRITHRTHDGLGRIVSVDQGGLETSYTYDPGDLITRIVDPRGRQVRMRYDVLGRLTHRETYGALDPVTGDPIDAVLVTTFDEYDGEGGLLRMTDPRGQEFRFDVDDLGRRTGAHGPATTSSISDKAWEFDENGNPTLERVTRWRGPEQIIEEVRATWDRQERLEDLTQRGLQIDFGYDLAGNRTLVSAPGGSTTYGYDARGFVTSAAIGSDVTTFEREPDGQIRLVARPNGSQTQITYEPTRRVDAITHRSPTGIVLAENRYDYDRDGNRTREVATLDDVTRTTQYEFDTLSRLESFTVVDGDVEADAPVFATGLRTRYSYTGYDRTGEAMTVAGAVARTRAYAHDGYGRLASMTELEGSVSRTLGLTYDDNGNVTSMTDSSAPSESAFFEYDPWDHMVAARRGSPTAGPLARYEYDAAGTRIRELGTARGDIEAYHVGGRLLEERRPSSGALGALYAHYHDGPLGWLRIDGETEQSWYHADSAGSTVAMSGGAGSATATTRMDPWGAIESQTGTSINRQNYTGHRTDDETDLVYMGARYYAPELGLFLSADSYLGDPSQPASLHRYLYANANPTRYWDSDGHSADEFTNSTSSSWGADAAVDGGNSNAAYQPFASEASEGVHPAEARRQLSASFTREAMSQAFDIDWGAAAETFATTFVVGAVGAGGIAFLAAVCPPAAILAVAAVALVGIFQLGADFVDRWESAAAMGSEHPASSAFLATAGSAVGFTQLIEGVTGHDVITGRQLSRQERGARLGEVGGGVAVGFVAPGIARLASRGGSALRGAARAVGRSDGAGAAIARQVDGGGRPRQSVGRESLGRTGQVMDEVAEPRLASCARPGACGGPACFVAGTLIASLVGPLPVEALEVGDRVRALDESACVSAESRDLVRVAVLYATPEHEWDTTYVEVLVERTEADERGYAAGRTVHFEHAGLGIDTVVEVVSVEPADVAEGEGCLVVATITHQNGELVRLRVSGSDEEIVATRTHPIWSLSREEWIQAADLALGELVQTASGPAAVESLEALYQLRQVFNFEVEGAHEYLVGEAGLRAHNGGTCPALRPDGHVTYDVAPHGNLSPGANRAPGHTNTAADRYVQSHHPVQDAWAERYANAHNLEYDRDAAPAVLLRSSSGEVHARISALQRARRRVEGWDAAPHAELRTSYAEMLQAGVPERVARKAIGDSYVYLARRGFFE